MRPIFFFLNCHIHINNNNNTISGFVIIAGSSLLSLSSHEEGNLIPFIMF